MMKQRGTDWLRQAHITNISPLGEQVADLLGDMLVGLYHLEDARQVDWANTDYIEVRVAYKDWATFDSSLLTRFVFLAHDRCLRAEIVPRSHHALTLRFHERQRSGRVWQRHPTLEEALTAHRQMFPLDNTVEVPT